LVFDIIRKNSKSEKNKTGKFGFFVEKPYLKVYNNNNINKKRELITEKIVKQWIENGIKRIILKKMTIITPLAWELIKEKNIEVEFD